MDALKLQDQLKLPENALSEGKKKEGVGLGTPLRTHRWVTDAVPAVLCAEHPGKPVGGASGRAVHPGMDPGRGHRLVTALADGNPLGNLCFFSC